MGVDVYIMNRVVWDELPPHIREHLSNEQKEYEKKILIFSFKYQLRYSNNLVAKVYKNEKRYYQQLMDHSLNQLMLYPYHIQDKVVPGLGLSPFRYYRSMLIKIMLAERSYDCLPNFTAADCLRLLGVGRNQYIELMNSYRSVLSSKKDMQESHSDLISNILPQYSIGNISIRGWYTARIGKVTLKDVELSSDEERNLIDKIIDSELSLESSDFASATKGMAVKDCDMDTLLSLHRRGLIYFDVPVSESDRISVPTLDGFVMNRITGDSCETLLYKIFVSVDERTTVSELASDLLVNIDLVRQAISVFLRLGFACKRNSQSIDSELNAISTDGLGNPLQMETEDLSKKKIAILFDSTLAAYLMMGNLSSGLKRHAVTMFEVGKLTDENLESFLTELDNLTDVGEGEAQIYYEHAVNLRAMLRFFRHLLSNSGSNNMFNGLDLLRCGSLLSLEPETRLRILKKNYGLLISLAPITYEDQQAANYQWPPHFGPPIPEANSPWFRLFIAYLAFERRSNFMDIPPCLILSRGSRLNTIPTCMLPYSLFSFIAWGHDPTIIESANLLSVVNDALVASPVFIQAYGFPFYSGDHQILFLPLPIPKGSSISGLLSCFHPLLNLYSLAGYITLLVTKPVCPATSDTDKTGPLFQIPVGLSPDRQTTCLGSRHIFDYSICLSPEDLRYLPVPASAGRHALIALHLGVPLFNASLSKAVYHGLTGLSGCSGQNQSGPLAELETANRQLVGQLACFISLLSSDEIGAEEKGDKLKTLLRTNLPLKASMRLTGVYSNSKTWADVWMHRLATHCTGSGPGPWPLPVHSILLGDAGLQFLD